VLVGGPSSAKISLWLKSVVTPLPMICKTSLTTPLEQTFCFGICFDGTGTFDHRI